MAAETVAAVETAAATETVGTAAETGAAAAAAEAGVHLDLGQGDLVKGAKMHGRRCGAHEKKRDQHLECANLCPVEITFWSVAVGAYVRNLIPRLRRRVREFRLRRRVREFCNKSEPRTGHTRVPDSTHNELKHTTTHKTATHERTPDKPHVLSLLTPRCAPRTSGMASNPGASCRAPCPARSSSPTTTHRSHSGGCGPPAQDDGRASDPPQALGRRSLDHVLSRPGAENRDDIWF